VLTYPRTDSRHLPEDYIPTVKETLGAFGGTAYGPHAATIIKNGWVHPNKRIFNNAKVSDHFAIIPTGAQPKTLSEAEQKVYDLVTKRFLAIFYPAAEYNITTRITRIEKHAFKTEGKVLVTPGWLAVYGKEAQGDEESPNLPPLEKNERIWTKDVEVKGKATQPPPRFTEATLLTAMEGAGKLIEDEELREAMSERGLGTPATRAATIEGLLAEPPDVSFFFAFEIQLIDAASLAHSQDGESSHEAYKRRQVSTARRRVLGPELLSALRPHCHDNQG
jgi:DNA topoisomerase-3